MTKNLVKPNGEDHFIPAPNNIYNQTLRQVVGEFVEGTPITAKCPKCQSTITANGIGSNAIEVDCECGFMCNKVVYALIPREE